MVALMVMSMIGDQCLSLVHPRAGHCESAQETKDEGLLGRNRKAIVIGEAKLDAPHKSRRRNWCGQLAVHDMQTTEVFCDRIKTLSTPLYTSQISLNSI